MSGKLVLKADIYKDGRDWGFRIRNATPKSVRLSEHERMVAHAAEQEYDGERFLPTLTRAKSVMERAAVELMAYEETKSVTIHVEGKAWKRIER